VECWKKEKAGRWDKNRMSIRESSSKYNRKNSRGEKDKERTR
jgi:hypothetical protein